MAYPAAVQAALDRAGVSTLEEWNAAMSQGTAGGVNAVQRAAGFTNPGEVTWTRVEDASAFAEEANRQMAVSAELERRRGAARDLEWAAYQQARLPDLSVPSPWNPTPTNYNPDPLGRTDLERQRAEIAAADAAWNGAETSVPLQVLEERRSGIPIRAIDNLGGHAEFTNQPPTAATEGEPVGFIGDVAGGVGKFLSGGAKALLESRRESGSVAVQQYTGDPPTVAGMPSYSQAGLPWGALGQTIGKVAGALGTAYTASQVGSAMLNWGKQGVVMGAVSPKKVNRATLTCPPKYVLGVDGQCYPKSMLPRSARKWTPDPKPVVSRSDQKAITRAASAKKRLVKLTNAAGAHATITRPHKHTTSSRKK